jgi:hypothetical protein
VKRRQINHFRPGLDRLEERRVLSAGVKADFLAHPAALATPGPPEPASTAKAAPAKSPAVSAEATEKKPNYGFLVYRITNPTPYNNKIVGPLGQVLVQTQQPVPGQVYNVLQVAVRNGTAQTFTASSNFEVKFPGDPTTFPILTGTETWAPGQDYIFYVLTKKYYPLPSQVHSGFEFSLEGARSIGIPGPSGIYLGVKYDPTTFPSLLDWIVTKGPGAQCRRRPIGTISAVISERTAQWDGQDGPPPLIRSRES